MDQRAHEHHHHHDRKHHGHGPAATAAAAPAEAGAQYTCPMHPQIVRDAPGGCPICGMALVPIAGTGEADDSELRDLTRRFWIGTALTNGPPLRSPANLASTKRSARCCLRTKRSM